jgi:hypothetical protein
MAGRALELVVIITAVAVFAFFALSADHFLAPFAISNILTFASINGIVVLGVAILMISEFDCPSAPPSPSPPTSSPFPHRRVNPIVPCCWHSP